MTRHSFRCQGWKDRVLSVQTVDVRPHNKGEQQRWQRKIVPTSSYGNMKSYFLGYSHFTRIFVSHVLHIGSLTSEHCMMQCGVQPLFKTMVHFAQGHRSRGDDLGMSFSVSSSRKVASALN